MTNKYRGSNRCVTCKRRISRKGRMLVPALIRLAKRNSELRVAECLPCGRNGDNAN